MIQILIKQIQSENMIRNHYDFCDSITGYRINFFRGVDRQRPKLISSKLVACLPVLGLI